MQVTVTAAPGRTGGARVVGDLSSTGYNDILFQGWDLVGRSPQAYIATASGLALTAATAVTIMHGGRAAQVSLPMDDAGLASEMFGKESLSAVLCLQATVSPLEFFCSVPIRILATPAVS